MGCSALYDVELLNVIGAEFIQADPLVLCLVDGGKAQVEGKYSLHTGQVQETFIITSTNWYSEI